MLLLTCIEIIVNTERELRWDKIPTKWVYSLHVYILYLYGELLVTTDIGKMFTIYINKGLASKTPANVAVFTLAPWVVLPNEPKYVNMAKCFCK
jgi:hypothetical protein